MHTSLLQANASPFIPFVTPTIQPCMSSTVHFAVIPESFQELNTDLKKMKNPKLFLPVVHGRKQDYGWYISMNTQAG